MSAPDLEESDVEAVVQALRSGRLALGDRAQEFERNFAAYVGTREAVAVSSGTAALHVIVRALGLGPGDEVLTVAYTFIATAEVAKLCGAEVRMVEIDPITYNIALTIIEQEVEHEEDLQALLEDFELMIGAMKG